jgi:YhcH/YjgK/YiaL family protein
MIIDHIANYRKYVGLHPLFDRAFEFLNGLKDDDRGSFPINGKSLFASVAEVTGRGREAAKLEIHKQYIDIQYIMDGADFIGWAASSETDPGTEYDQSNDYRFVEIEPVTWVDVPRGYFVIFFPEDAHAPLAGNDPMTKVFMKVKII